MKITQIHNLLTEEDLKGYEPVKAKVCRECHDCCSDLVSFELDHIKSLKKRYRKLFRGTKLVPFHDTFYINNTSLKKGKCIFLKNSECLIYDERPDICVQFGSSPIAGCGLEGLDYCPPKEERDGLSVIAKKKSIILMETLFNRIKRKTID